MSNDLPQDDANNLNVAFDGRLYFHQSLANACSMVHLAIQKQHIESWLRGLNRVMIDASPYIAGEKQTKLSKELADLSLFYYQHNNLYRNNEMQFYTKIYVPLYELTTQIFIAIKDLRLHSYTNDTSDIDALFKDSSLKADMGL